MLQKNKAKLTLVTVLAMICCLLVGLFGLSACSEPTNGKDGVGIKSTRIDENGKLIVELTDGTVSEPFDVKGEDGVSVVDAQINADGKLVIKLSNGETLTSTNAVKGEDGVSVTNAEIRADGHLWITLSNDKEIDCGLAKGTNGSSAEIEGIEKEDGNIVINYTDGSTTTITMPALLTTCEHDWVWHNVSGKADCSPEAVWMIVCQNGLNADGYYGCGISYVHKGSHADHDTEWVESHFATCTEEGWDAHYVCTECEYESVDGKVWVKSVEKDPAIGHAYADYYTDILKDPDDCVCEDSFWRGYECTNIDQNTGKKCTDVQDLNSMLAGGNEVGSVINVAPLGHISKDWKLGLAPTATTEGYLTGRCDRCGKANAEFRLPKLVEANILVKLADKAPESETLVANSANTDVVYTYTVTEPRTTCRGQGYAEYRIVAANDTEVFKFKVELAPQPHAATGSDNVTYEFEELAVINPEYGVVQGAPQYVPAGDAHSVYEDTFSGTHYNVYDYSKYEDKDILHFRGGITEPAACGETPDWAFIDCERCKTVVYFLVRDEHVWELVPHNADNYTAPQCGVAGSETYECSVCGELEVRPIAALEHKWSYAASDVKFEVVVNEANPTEVISAVFAAKCSVCGTFETDIDVTKLLTSEVADPTCQTAGNVVYTYVHKVNSVTKGTYTKEFAIAATGKHKLNGFNIYLNEYYKPGTVNEPANGGYPKFYIVEEKGIENLYVEESATSGKQLLTAVTEKRDNGAYTLFMTDANDYSTSFFMIAGNISNSSCSSNPDEVAMAWMSCEWCALPEDNGDIRHAIMAVAKQPHTLKAIADITDEAYALTLTPNYATGAEHTFVLTVPGVATPIEGTFTYAPDDATTPTKQVFTFSDANLTAEYVAVNGTDWENATWNVTYTLADNTVVTRIDVDASAACTFNSQDWFYCSVCTEYVTELTAAKGHTYIEDPTNEKYADYKVEPTCTTDGYWICTICNDTSKKIEKLNHDFKVVVTTEATTEADGLAKITCERVGCTYESTITLTKLPVESEWVESDCNVEGSDCYKWNEGETHYDAAGYHIVEILGTCKIYTSLTYTKIFTHTPTDGTAAHNFEYVITIDGEREPHQDETTGITGYTWKMYEVLNGVECIVEYEGYKCTNCNQIITTNIVTDLDGTQHIWTLEEYKAAGFDDIVSLPIPGGKPRA